jgi:multiple sugar transport system substrate-binding protein
MTAMTFGGSWNMGLYVDAFGESLGVVQLPVMKEKSTISHSLSWVGAASTAHPEEVKTFLTYMAGAEAQAFASVQVIPAYEGTDAQWAARFENYNTNAFLGAIAEGWAHALPAAEKNVQEIFTKFDSYMVEMLSTGEIETNLAAMEAEFNELLK